MKQRITQFALLIVLGLTAPASAQTSALPAYQPQAVEPGVIRSWGHVFLKKVMAEWETAFAAQHPGVTFSDNLVSSAAATGALFTHTADLGILGREIRPMEVAGYTRVMKHKPFPLEVMTGSWANADKSVALGIFVSESNPLTKLSFAQLDAIFGAEHLAGAPANIRKWGQLGVRGPLASHSIHPYGGELDAAPAFYFSQTVMHGSQLWNEQLRHVDDIDRPDRSTYVAQQHIVDELSNDPDGIALSGVGFKSPGIKLLAIAAAPGGPYIQPTPATVEDRTYPLSRSVWIYTNQAPGQPLDPRTREFLRFIFSSEGQELVREEGEYLPLTPALAAAQLRKLDQ